MTTNHTPGPWGRNIKPASHYPIIYAGRNTHVAQVISRGLTDAECEANCDLIAAAPDLLAALTLAEDVLSRAPFSTGLWPNGMHPNVGIEAIRAAIAKAQPNGR
jgi:hypothetical protein